MDPGTWRKFIEIMCEAYETLKNKNLIVLECEK